MDKKSKQSRQKPVSLYPLTLEQAVTKILKYKPVKPDKKKPKKK